MNYDKLIVDRRVNVYQYNDDSLMLHNDLYQIMKATGMMVSMKE